MFYHGTSEIKSEFIVNEGLRPSRHTKINNWRNKSIQPISIGCYLTNNIERANYYAMRTALLDNSDCSIIYVDGVNEKRLYPDENLYNMDISLTFKRKHYWKKSLIEKGLVLHSGRISKSKIKGVVNLKVKENCWYGLIKWNNSDIYNFDRSIHIINQLHKKKWFGDIENMQIKNLSIYHIDNVSSYVEYYGGKDTMKFIDVNVEL